MGVRVVGSSERLGVRPESLARAPSPFWKLSAHDAFVRFREAGGSAEDATTRRYGGASLTLPGLGGSLAARVLGMLQLPRDVAAAAARLVEVVHEALAQGERR